MQNKDMGFDADQRAEIDAGIAEGLNVDCYAKKEFMAIQMRQIRLGMMDGLDVSVYARPEYDWFQMEEIRKGMQEGINYGLYAKPELDYGRMRQLRKGLSKGIDLSNFAKLNAGILRQLRKAILNKVSIVDYIKQGYIVEQLEEIRKALQKGLDIKPYLSKEFTGSSIKQISKGLEMGVNPSLYATIEYGWQQMREIRLGMEHRVDVSLYANSLYSWQQMREIRLGLEDGIDVSAYLSFVYTATDMERIRSRLSKGVLEDILEGTTEHEITRSPAERLRIFISNDEMEACLEVKGEKSEVITVEEILGALKSEGVTAGILEDELRRIADERRYKQTIVVAKGKPPVRGADGRYEYYFETEIDRSPHILPDGSADYRNIRWYELVEEGQKLAYYYEADWGTPGYTVTGKTIEAKKGREKNVLSGKGFVLMPDGKTYIAALSGKIDLVLDKKMEITRLCVLDEVNLATGNIDFDGCVYVRGDVGSGAIIHATEDIIVSGSVESAFIRCGGQVLLRQGANGAGNGLIEAGKTVTGSFFEAIRVKAGEDIHANYCLNCELFAGSRIVINGTRGLIAGGVAQAIKKISAYNVGNHARIKTILRLGVDDAALHKKATLEKGITEVSKELVILGNAYIDFQRKYPPEVRNTMDMYLKIENAIYTKELQLNNLYNEQKEIDKVIDNMSGAKAVVAGCLYEGTTIIIDNLRWSAYNIQDVTVKRINDKIVAYSN